MPWTDDYIGLPFKIDGRTRMGCDCWGLICVVFREYLGIELPEYKRALGNNLKNDPKSIKKAIEIESKKWIETDIPKVFDVALFRTNGKPEHLGLVINRREMLHTMAGISSTIESFRGLEWKNRLVGFYRYAK